MLKRAIVPLGIAALLVACASHPGVGKPVARTEGGVLVIDDQYHLTRETPGWIFLEAAEIEKSAGYRDRYAFKGVSAGSDLSLLQRWAKDFVGSPDPARFVGVRVRNRLQVLAACHSSVPGLCLEDVVQSVSRARYPDARIEQRYWRRTRAARAAGGFDDLYEYHVLYTVDRGQVDAVIASAFAQIDRNAAVKTEQEKTARERVRELLESEGLGG